MRRFALVLIFLAAGLWSSVTAGAARIKSGTGFFVTRDGILLTSEHVVAGCPEISIWEAKGAQHAAHVIGTDPRLDLALLRAEGTRPHRAAVIGQAAPLDGGEVFTLGFGVVATDPLDPIPVKGALVGYGTAESGNRVVLIRASLHAGHSGAALLSEAGSLIGMIIGRDESHGDIGIAVPQNDLLPFLATYGVGLRNPEPNSRPRELLSEISVLVQCPATGQ